jgi:hypothetical protein
VKLAKRLAFVESNLFARIFRLDEQISRIRAFMTRNDIEPAAKIDLVILDEFGYLRSARQAVRCCSSV